MVATKVSAGSSRLELPLDDAVRTLRHDRELKRALLGIPFPVAFFCLFIAMLFDHIPSQRLYEQGASVASVLDSSGTDAITDSTTMKFRNIGAPADVFDWLIDTLVPSVFVTQDYNGNDLSKDKWGRIAQFNKVLGAVTLEFTISQPAPCRAQPFLTTLYPNCNDVARTSVRTYMIPFDMNATAAAAVVEELKANGTWIDFNTMLLGVTIVTYNGELQGYTVTKLKIEFHQGGALELSSSTTPTVSDPYKNDDAIVLDALVAGCVLVSVLDVLRMLFCGCRSHFRRLGSPLLVLASTALVAAFYAMWFSMVFMMRTKEFRENLARLVKTGKTFGSDSDELRGLNAVTRSLERVADITVALRLVASATVVVLGLRILQQFSFHPKLNMLTRTVANALNQFAAFFAVFLVIFFTFAVCGMVLFGDSVEAFSTILKSMESCVNMLFGSFDLATIQEIHVPLGTLYYWAYMVVVCLVLLNMMLAIVLDSYAAICEESATININISFRRSLANILYDLLVLVTGRARVLGSMKRRALGLDVGSTVAGLRRHHVVFGGRVVPAVLERVLVPRLEKATSAGKQSEVLTPAKLLELFPGGIMSEQEAAQTLQFLVVGSYNASTSKNEKNGADPDTTSREGVSVIDASDEKRECVTTGPTVELVRALERVEALEKKLDRVLTALEQSQP
ncbi:hypothetical protein PINS_up006074 [Pythium insidiosum]|nr:hypothetical protein PINS_up006074 [Pythium insidiosum]